MEILKQEEESIQIAEEDAREQMAALRKTQREEREARRRADLEKKKQDALAKREKEKKMMEEARKKEQEMLERIADAEMRRAIREEEERKRDEEERLAQERYEVSSTVFQPIHLHFSEILFSHCFYPNVTTCIVWWLNGHVVQKSLSDPKSSDREMKKKFLRSVQDRHNQISPIAVTLRILVGGTKKTWKKV